MATVRERQTDFTGGEWSPRALGRVDLDRYIRSAKILENFVVLQAGGLQRRPGTRYAGTAPGKSRLIAFVFAAGQAYAVEFSALSIRFYGGATSSLILVVGVPVVVVSTYTEAECFELGWVQSADVLFLVHPNHPPARLDRLKNDGTLWRLSDIVFDVPPTFEFGLRPTVTVTPSATTGAGVTFTASAPIFLASDVGRKIVVTAGASVGASATVTGFTDTTHVLATVTAAFANLAAIAATDWHLDTSPMTGITPSVKDPAGATVTLTLDSDGFRAGDVGKFVLMNGGAIELTVFTDALHMNGIIRALLTSTTKAPSGAWSLEEAAFSTLNGYPSVVTFAGDRLWFMNTRAQPQTRWGSKTGDYFNFAKGALADDGLQETLNSDQVNPILWAKPNGRTLVVGTASEEWVSDPGEGNAMTPDNFGAVPQTGNGSAANVPVLKVGAVLLFVTRSGRKLREFVFEFTSNNYADPDLTVVADHLTRPTRLRGRLETRGIIDLALQREPQRTVWGVREDGTLLGLTYLRDQHVVGWHRQVFGDLTDRDDEDRQIPVHDDMGTAYETVESMCITPHPDGTRDQVWLAIKRLIGGASRRHIEWLDDVGLNFDSGLVVDDAISIDGQQYMTTLTRSSDTGPGVTFTASGAVFDASMIGGEIRLIGQACHARIVSLISPMAVQADVLIPFTGFANPLSVGAWGIARVVVTGLGHLEARQVQITGDGAVYPPMTVVGGQVKLGYAAMKIEAGIGYLPRVKFLQPEVAGVGTVQALPKRKVKLYLRLDRTLGLTIDGGSIVPFRVGGDPLGEGAPVFTGDKALTNLGWGDDGEIEIQQTQALPCTILAAFSLLSTED